MMEMKIHYNGRQSRKAESVKTVRLDTEIKRYQDALIRSGTQRRKTGCLCTEGQSMGMNGKARLILIKMLHFT